MTDLDAAIAELAEWLRIPSVSTAGGNPAALREAAEWALRHVLEAGGTGELIQLDPPDHPPLVVAELRANREDAPTILIYGHYDVQDAGDEARWTTPAFEPDIRDGRLYARGASDDKGNFLPLLLVACELADAGELGVNVRILVEGEEETPTDTAERWMAADERGADAAIVFDAGMLDADTPALTVGTRGMVWADLVVTTGERPVHSGEFGGAALNAVHVLHRLLAAVLPDPESGRPPEPLRAGLEPPSAEELEAWAQLPPGDRLLAEAGARPADARAGEELHLRTMAGTSVDVHRLHAGEARTIVPERAEANLSVRLAGGQRSEEIVRALERLLRDALPAGAELELRLLGAEPSRFDPAAPALVAACRALERATGVAPVVVRSGGSIPILAAFGDRGIPTIVGGFALPEDRIHAPDESYRIASLELGLNAARALYDELASLT